MTTDPTMHIVWFNGRPYPVSSHPSGVDDPGTHWHVQTPDGEWHPIMRRSPGTNDDASAWSDVMVVAQSWLADRDRAHNAHGRRA
jgi:hypothetical protein